MIPASWPYVSRRLATAWLPNREPFRPAAVYVGATEAATPAHPTTPDVFYRLSPHVVGRLLAAIDRLPRDTTEHREAAAAARALLAPLLSWLADRYREAALKAGAIAAEGWQALDDEIDEARRAPASGPGSMPLTRPEAGEAEIRMLERVVAGSRAGSTAAVAAMLWCPLDTSGRPSGTKDSEDSKETIGLDEQERTMPATSKRQRRRQQGVIVDKAVGLFG